MDDTGRNTGGIERPLPPGVPSFAQIAENEHRIGSPSSSCRSPFFEEVFPCECRYNPSIPSLASQACGEHSSCINRTLFIECNPEDCPAGEHCQNQRFQQRRYAEVQVFETPGKGFGLCLSSDVSPGAFIIEYVGEVLNQAQFEARAERYSERGQRHFYFMTLQSDQIIDATRKGNLSRFMNHSCNPNCETQKWIVNGHLRIGLFASRTIKAGTELTFDYKYIRFGGEAQRCLCGEANCKGIIGMEQRDLRGSSLQAEQTSREEESRTILQRYDGEHGAGSPDEIATVAKLLLRAEDLRVILALLRTLIRTTDSALLRRFISLHGLQIINVLMGQNWRVASIMETVIELLECLPVQTRNSVEDSHLEEKMQRLVQRDTLDPNLVQRAKSLLHRWSCLERIFRIPKVSSTATVDGKGMQSQAGSIATTSTTTMTPSTTIVSGYNLMEDERYRRPKWSTPFYQSPDPTRELSLRSPQDSSSSPHNRTGGGNGSGDAKKRPLSNPSSTSNTSTWPPQQPSQPHYRLASPSEDQQSKRFMATTEASAGIERIKHHQYQHQYQHQHQQTPQQSQQQKNSWPDDSERRLEEIIERARKAALSRSAPSATGGKRTATLRETEQRRTRPSPSSSVSEASSRQLETRLRDQTSAIVVKYLSRWCRDQLLSPEAFKDLARKLTHGLVEKEMRSWHMERPTSEQQLLVEPSSETMHRKRAKIKQYLIQYLRNHGYRVEEEQLTGQPRSLSVSTSSGSDAASAAGSSGNLAASTRRDMTRPPST